MNENDRLRSLLHEWKALEPPAEVRARVLAAYRAGRRQSLWGRLWSIRVTIPAPVLAAAVLLIAVGLWLASRPGPANPAPAAPAGGAYMTRLETAGFQPLPDGEVRIIRSGVKQ